ncbi:hypothetical protein Tco_0837392 [Tanacetum coccineum]
MNDDLNELPFLGSLKKDENDEISSLVDLLMYMLGDGWKWQDLALVDVDGKILMLALVDHFGFFYVGAMLVHLKVVDATNYLIGKLLNLIWEDQSETNAAQAKLEENWSLIDINNFLISPRERAF